MTGSILPSRAARGEVDAVLLQRLEGALRVGAGDARGAAHRLQRVGQRGRGDAAVREQVATSPPCWASAISRCSVETYSSLRSRASRSAALRTARSAREACGAPTDAPDGGRQAVDQLRRRRLGRCSGSTPDGLQQRAGQALGVVEQRHGEVRRLDRRVAALGGGPHRAETACWLRVVRSMGVLCLRSIVVIDTTPSKLSLFRST